MQFKQDDANIEEVIATYRLAGIHPAADLFPMIEDEEKFSELCESVNQHGVEIPIILTHDNYLLDGRNRLKACFLTGQVPRWDKKSDLYKDDYVGLALRLNKDRRHLSASQLAALAVDLEAIYAAEAKERQRKSGEQYGRGEKVEERFPQPLESKTLPQARDLAAQQESGEQYGRGEKVEARLPQPLESKTLLPSELWKEVSAQAETSTPEYVKPEIVQIQPELPVKSAVRFLGKSLPPRRKTPL